MQPQQLLKSPRIFLKWLIICSVVGAPSFVIAVSTMWYRPSDILAMATGIMTFVILLTLVDLSSWFTRLYEQRHFRSAFKTGLVVRFVMTVALPVVIFFDMGCGQISVELISFVPVDYLPFLATYLISLIQGLILSASIVLKMVIAWACLLAYARLKRYLFAA